MRCRNRFPLRLAACRKVLRGRRAVALLWSAFAVSPAEAAVNDVFPADYVAAPAQSSSVALYLYDRRLAGPYADGRRLLEGGGDSQVAALRVVHTVDVKGVKVAPMAVLSWGNIEFSPPPLNRLAAEASAFGDLRLGATSWLIDRPDERHWLGLTAIAILPTGTYHTGQPVNIMAENRYRLVIGGGWIHPLLGRDVLLEVSPEAAWYGRNGSYLGNHELTQSPTAALTTYLRYRPWPALHLHAGWQGNWGGQTRIDGVDQHNAPNNRRLMAGMTVIAGEGTQLIVRYASDTHIDNGFRQKSEFSLRIYRNFR